MNLSIGQVATGDQFYIRQKLIDKLWNKITTGHNILMSAPRRIGKTSIMQYCLNHPIDNHSVIYLITESVNNQNEFYRKLVKEVYEKMNTTNKIKSYFKTIIASNKIKSIGPDGLSLEAKDVDYYEEFKAIVELLEMPGQKLVLMIDEYAQTVENIMQDEGESSAVRFLESVRELRMTPAFNHKIQMIFAGSIGLENIVAQLNAVSTINDLHHFKVTPFTKDEAFEYITTIPLKGESYDFQPSEIEYLLERLQWNIPYFINIILDEIDTICDDRDTTCIDKVIIDQAFTNTLKNRSYFEHWHTRLRKAYKQNNYNFSKEILNQLAQQPSITKAEVLNIAVGLDIKDTYKEIMNGLLYDGYVYIPDNEDKYVFNSPLLRQWWFNNVTN